MGHQDLLHRTAGLMIMRSVNQAMNRFRKERKRELDNP